MDLGWGRGPGRQGEREPGQHFPKTLLSWGRGPTEGLQKYRSSRGVLGGGTRRDSKGEDVKASGVNGGQCWEPGVTVLVPIRR